MRFAIIYRPKDPPTREQMPEVIQGMAGWMEKYGDRVEGIEFFVGGGGFGTIETNDAAELTRLINENPFSIHSEIEIVPLVDPAIAIGIIQEGLS
jgi:hypothetical protein